MAQKLILGKGSEVVIAPDFEGLRVAPTAQTVTVGTGGAAAGATTVPVTALTEDIFANTFLQFRNPTTGAESAVHVTANAVTGATSLTVAALNEPLSAGDTAPTLIKLQNRTTANLGTNVNDITTQTFDTGIYQDGAAVGIGYTVAAGGNLSQQDAAYQQCRYCFNEAIEVYFELRLPKPLGYARGYVFKGFASVSNAPVDVPADNLVTTPLDFTVRAKLTELYPARTAA